MESIAAFLVGSGAVVLVLAAVTIGQLIAALPSGRIRGDWYLLLGFVACFILGYLGYLVFLRGIHHSLIDLIAPAVFFMGAGFVALVARVALRTARDLSRMKRLEEENVTDALTGLHNRRAFDQRWRAELARAQRFGLPIALLVIDIDHFKSVNDTFGHTVGDQVLMAVARTISGTVRESDIAARYGGEELAVIAPHTRPAAAVHLAERMRADIEQHACRALGQAAGQRRITASIGVAACENAAQGCERMFERADEALYAAKHGGRNRVAAAGGEPALELGAA